MEAKIDPRLIAQESSRWSLCNAVRTDRPFEFMILVFSRLKKLGAPSQYLVAVILAVEDEGSQWLAHSVGGWWYILHNAG